MKIEFVDNDTNVQTNEVDRKAMGGTELMKYALHKKLDPELLKNFQIIPSRVRDLDKDKIKVLWLHDLPLDPESAHLKDGGWEKFDRLVFVSHWQQQQYANYLGVPYKAGVVLKNAIEPFSPNEIVKGDPTEELRIIYHTTPHRGLDILVPVFEKLSEKFDNIVLDVFSSFNAYGWPERDKPFEALFERCKNHPKINYHGYQPNDVVRKALGKAHIFAYPSIWPETSCIALMEAMSAGCLCVHSSLAALTETSANWTYMYGFNEDINAHAQIFHSSLEQCIEMLMYHNKVDALNNRLSMQKNYIDAFYNWEVRRHEWTGLLKGLVELKKREAE